MGGNYDNHPARVGLYYAASFERVVAAARKLPALPGRHMMEKHFTPALLVAAVVVLGCSKGDNTSSTAGSDSAAAAAPTTSSASDSGNAPVRGTLASITDTSVTITSRNGNVTLPIA